MITIIFFAILPIIIIAWIHRSELKCMDLEEWILSSLFCMIFGLIGSLVGTGISLALPADTEYNHWNSELISLQDGGSIQGSFFLGCGQIDGTMKYTYYTQSDDGYYRMHQKDRYNAAIDYCNCAPYVEYIDHVFTDHWSNWFALDHLDKQQAIFHVPKGTIKNQFILDAQ